MLPDRSSLSSSPLSFPPEAGTVHDDASLVATPGTRLFGRCVRGSARRTIRRVLWVFLAAAAVSSCATGAPAGESPSAERRPGGAGAVAPYLGAPDFGLRNEAFAGIDDVLASYLRSIGEAVRSHDGAFLEAQGEPSWEAEYRSFYGTGRYLALLYRIGPYSAENPVAEGAPPNLDVAALRGMEYQALTDRGIVMEVRGRFFLSGGATLPFSLYVLARLDPPKLLGAEP